MSKEPKRPQKNDPLELKLRGDGKTPSEWAKLATKAEEGENWGDAYYYWLAGSSAYTRSTAKAKQYKINAETALGKWRENE